jgi:hypothetical protein
MGVRMTIEVPEFLQQRLQRASQQSGTSIQSVIVRAIEQTYGKQKEGKLVTGPMIPKGKTGPEVPKSREPTRFGFCVTPRRPIDGRDSGVH